MVSYSTTSIDGSCNLQRVADNQVAVIERREVGSTTRQHRRARSDARTAIDGLRKKIFLHILLLTAFFPTSFLLPVVNSFTGVAHPSLSDCSATSTCPTLRRSSQRCRHFVQDQALTQCTYTPTILYYSKSSEEDSTAKIEVRAMERRDEAGEMLASSKRCIQQRRRSVLATSLFPAAFMVSSGSTAMAATESSVAGLPATIPADQATITQRVFFDVRISRQDGTFYVRDDLPDLPENQVFRGRLTIGLFGNAVPNHVRRFLEYVTSASDPAGVDATPLPSYSRSVFNQFDEGTGVLYGGAIPSLDVTTLPQGSSAIQYGGRLLPAQLWINNSNKKGDGVEQRLSHIGKGLLTHRNLDVTPVFGVTTRRDTTALDRSHTVFGRLILDETTQAFLDRVSQLPVYAVDTRPSPTNNEPTVVDDAAAAVFRAQRDFFRTTAKRLGDTRIDKLVTGKLLRRVEVTQVGML